MRSLHLLGFSESSYLSGLNKEVQTVSKGGREFAAINAAGRQGFFAVCSLSKLDFEALNMVRLSVELWDHGFEEQVEFDRACLFILLGEGIEELIKVGLDNFHLSWLIEG